MITAEQEFPGVATSAQLARAFVASLVVDSRLRDAAVLAVGELAANAIRHSRSGLPGGTFSVYVEVELGWDDATQACTYVEVTDQGGGVIPLGGPELAGHAVGGRGLGIVRALTDEWGVISRCDCHVVWGRLYSASALQGLAAMS